MKFLYDTIACPDNNPSCLSGDMRVAKLVYDEASDNPNVNFTYYSYDAASLSRRVYDVGSNVMATYDRTITRTSVTATKRNYTDTYKTEELQVYGAKRLGVQLGSGTIVAATITQTISGNSDVIERMQGFSWSETNPMAFDNTKRVVNDRYYEMANHLGNVLVVVSDRKIEYNNLDYYTADVVSYSDYSPYGTLLDGRHGQQQNADYRYGFQGQEADDEIKGEGNSYNYTYRMHDPRIGRFFAIDPLAAKYPFYTPYQFSGNSVIGWVELEGLETGTSGTGVPAQFGMEQGTYVYTPENERNRDIITTISTEKVLTSTSSLSAPENAAHRQKIVQMQKNSGTTYYDADGTMGTVKVYQYQTTITVTDVTINEAGKVVKLESSMAVIAHGQQIVVEGNGMMLNANRTVPGRVGTVQDKDVPNAVGQTVSPQKFVTEVPASPLVLSAQTDYEKWDGKGNWFDHCLGGQEAIWYHKKKGYSAVAADLAEEYKAGW